MDDGTRCPSSQRLLDIVARTACPDGHVHNLATHNPEFEITEDTVSLIGIGLPLEYELCATCGQPNSERRVELQLRTLFDEGRIQ